MPNPPTLTHTHTTLSLSLSLSNKIVSHTFFLSSFSHTDITKVFLSFSFILSPARRRRRRIPCGRALSLLLYSSSGHQIHHHHPWRFIRRSPPLRRRSMSATSTPTSPTATSSTHSPSSRASRLFASAKTPPRGNPSVTVTSTSFPLKTVHFTFIHLSCRSFLFSLGLYISFNEI